MKKGRILIIDDSVLVRNYLTRIISTHPELEICGMASNGKIGFHKIHSSSPDVIILDLEMDQGDGLYVLQQIEEKINKFLWPFIIIYSSRAKHEDPLFKKAVDFGFCDFILKPEGSLEEIQTLLNQTLIPKIQQGITARKTRKLLSSSLENSTIELEHSEFPQEQEKDIFNVPIGLDKLSGVLQNKPVKPKIIILGASTGGPQAIQKIISQLSGTYIPVPIVIIQHMPEKFTLSFANELERISNIKTYELRHNMPLEKGNIYIFPGGIHGRLNCFGNLFVYYSEYKNYDLHPFKPSINLAIDYLLGSFSGQAVCAILSGMGKDGAIGAANLRKKGALVIAQDKDSSAVWGMPKAVLKENGADIILAQDEIGLAIRQILEQSNSVGGNV
ncbi:MAG: chemotaxis protein CheB [Brevinemataceae bacterium]